MGSVSLKQPGDHSRFVVTTPQQPTEHVAILQRIFVACAALVLLLDLALLILPDTLSPLSMIGIVLPLLMLANAVLLLHSKGTARIITVIATDLDQVIQVWTRRSETFFGSGADAAPGRDSWLMPASACACQTGRDGIELEAKQ